MQRATPSGREYANGRRDEPDDLRAAPLNGRSHATAARKGCCMLHALGNATCNTAPPQALLPPPERERGGGDDQQAERDTRGESIENGDRVFADDRQRTAGSKDPANFRG